MNLYPLLLIMCNMIRCNGKCRLSYFCCHIINKLNVFLRNRNKCLSFMIKMIYLSNFYPKAFLYVVFMYQITIIKFLFYSVCLHYKLIFIDIYFIKHLQIIPMNLITFISCIKRRSIKLLLCMILDNRDSCIKFKLLYLKEFETFFFS